MPLLRAVEAAEERVDEVRNLLVVHPRPGDVDVALGLPGFVRSGTGRPRALRRCLLGCQFTKSIIKHHSTGSGGANGTDVPEFTVSDRSAANNRPPCSARVTLPKGGGRLRGEGWGL